MNRNVEIITDTEGKKIVLINDIRFKSRRNIDWEKVEQYLKEYVGTCFEIAETSEKIQIATDKTAYPDYENKHKSKAKFGWYRYNTRFGIPKYDESGELEGYNIFSTRMLVRCAQDGHLYLYDLVRTKKETSKPLEQ